MPMGATGTTGDTFHPFGSEVSYGTRVVEVVTGTAVEVGVGAGIVVGVEPHHTVVVVAGPGPEPDQTVVVVVGGGYPGVVVAVEPPPELPPEPLPDPPPLPEPPSAEPPPEPWGTTYWTAFVSVATSDGSAIGDTVTSAQPAERGRAWTRSV
jgi:hypothetical protein